MKPTDSKIFIITAFLYVMISGMPVQCKAQIADADSNNIKSDSSLPEPVLPKTLTLVQAVMCEGIKELAPQNPSIIFSVSAGRIFCFTSFNPVPERMHIFHSWYRMDRLSQKPRLTLNIPAWSTYSTIQLRDATDIGPWRVEITDDKGEILEVLRFSITE